MCIVKKRNIQKELLDLINCEEFQELEKYYSNKTIMDILGVSRNETNHSNFIAWLLSSNGEHGLEDFPLRKLLETICFIDSKIDTSNYSILPTWINKDDIISGNYKLDNIKVEREKTINNKNKRRLDIYIEFDIQRDSKKFQKSFIIIENKINSTESKNQTKDYYNWAEKHSNENNMNFVCLFLSPQTKQEYRKYFKSGKNQSCTCETFIEINYQYLADGVIEPCILKVEASEYKLFLESYIRCLSQPSIDLVLNYSSNNEKTRQRNKTGNIEDIDYTIMAVGKSEKRLVKKIWKDNQKILKSIIQSVSGKDSDLSSNDKVLLKQFYNTKKVLKSILFVLTLLLEDINDIEDNKNYFDMVNSIFNNKICFYFNSKKYKKGGRSGNSYGWLGRDLIAEYARQNPNMKLVNFINLIQKQNWSSPWLDEIIVPRSEWRDDYPKNHGHFFEESNAIVKWNENTDIYVARYWTKDDILLLVELLGFKDKVELQY